MDDGPGDASRGRGGRAAERTDAARPARANPPDALLYSRPMASAAATFPSQGRARVLGWRRVRLVLAVGLALSVLLLPTWEGAWAVLFVRLVLIGLIQLLVFGLFERWPARLPRWLARWVLQVAGVAIAVPFAAALAYTLTTFGDAVPWPRDEGRLSGFGMITGLGVLLTPWIAMSALYRQVSGEAQRQ